MGTNSSGLKENDANNTFEGATGDDIINGYIGTDVAIFTRSKAGYTITKNSAGVITVTDKTTSRDDTDTLTGIETLRFSDQDVVTVTLNTLDFVLL